MGRLWDKFKNKFDNGPVVQELQIPAPPPKPQAPPMRAYRNEALSDEQRRDLVDVVLSEGYQVLLDLHESTLEGFITYLVETPPEDEARVLALHKLVHAGYLYNRSVQQQVEVYRAIEESDHERVKELKRAIAAKSGDPLTDANVLSKVLDPIYAPAPEPPKPVVVKQSKTTPLDTMLRGVAQ